MSLSVFRLPVHGIPALHAPVVDADTRATRLVPLVGGTHRAGGEMFGQVELESALVHFRVRRRDRDLPPLLVGTVLPRLPRARRVAVVPGRS
ncbi:hypothetical protein RRF57_000734 [Xylaria bambusicola]|uniref:Uncharacterized protein n=1 Tax=Xylaria bambusicola TaxID=326684 RepID=A0AAN7UAN9_9PEZI